MLKLIVAASLALTCVHTARAADYVVDATEPVRIVQADIAPIDAGAPVVVTGAGSGETQGTADVSPVGDPLAELSALKAKYEALKAAKGSGGSKDLIWFLYAAIGAGVLRALLALLTAWRGDKPKGWAKWVALGLAVPLYLLTYYAAGAGLWASLLMAGSGPGAIIVNELFKSFAKKPAAEAGN